jgi:hypothetical protein
MRFWKGCIEIASASVRVYKGGRLVFSGGATNKGILVGWTGMAAKMEWRLQDEGPHYVIII